MKISAVVPTLLAGLVAAVPYLEDPTQLDPEASEILRRQVPVKPCSHLTGGLHVIALGGANTENRKDYGKLYSLSQSILNAIPGSTNVSLPYDKVLANSGASGPPKLHPGAVSDGMRLLKQYQVEYHHHCPKTKIALIGYSSGGVIMMNDLCYGGDGVGTPQLNPALNGNIIVAAVAYGEETHTPNQPFNAGTCPQGNGVAPRPNPAGCNRFAPIIRSYCDLKDPDCCVGTGNDVNVHFAYPNKYDAAATTFVKNQLAKHGGA